jgi:hypothetical protein
MILSDAPTWGSFTFRYKDTDIYVPTFLNNVARYKPYSFWDWLIFVRYPRQSAVVFAYDNIGEEERWSKQVRSSASSVSLSPVQQDVAPPRVQYPH